MILMSLDITYSDNYSDKIEPEKLFMFICDKYDVLFYLQH